jgi:hypothetical protein
MAQHPREAVVLVAGYPAPYQPPRQPQPEPHIVVPRPGELVGIDCFYVGRLRGTAGVIWQLIAIACYSSYAWAELVLCKHDNPAAAHTTRLGHGDHPPRGCTYAVGVPKRGNRGPDTPARGRR